MKFQYKDDEGKTRLNSIITHVLKNKVQMALVDIDSQFQKITEVDKRQLKWNLDNIQFIWDLEQLTTLRELYDMLKIFSMEYIIGEWNNTLVDKDEDIFDVECIFDQTYVDSDLDYLLYALEHKGIKIQYNYDNRCIRFVDIDGTIFEAQTRAFTNRHDDLESEIIIFWDTLKEVSKCARILMI